MRTSDVEKNIFFIHAPYDYSRFILTSSHDASGATIDPHLKKRSSFIVSLFLRFLFKFNTKPLNMAGGIFLLFLFLFLFDKRKEFSLVFIDGHYLMQCPFLAKTLKAHFKYLKIFSWILNIRSECDIRRLKSSCNYIDKIYSFDRDYSRQYSLEYLPLRLNCELAQRHQDDDKCEYDIIFVGQDKPFRSEVASKIMHHCNRLGLTYYFYFVGSSECKSFGKGIGKGDALPYTDVLSLVSRSKSVLEILQPDGSSSTLRLYEAVCMGKLLITNASHLSSYSLSDVRSAISIEHFLSLSLDDFRKYSEGVIWPKNINASSRDFLHNFSPK